MATRQHAPLQSEIVHPAELDVEGLADFLSGCDRAQGDGGENPPSGVL